MPPGRDRMPVGEAIDRAVLQESDLERLAARLGPLSSAVRLRLLRFLTTPHYLEEVASHLGLTRQAARKHLDQLLAIGVVQKRAGTRDTGPVTDYVVNPQELFVILHEFERLGSLRPRSDDDPMLRTMVHTGGPVVREEPKGTSLTIVRGMDAGFRFPLAGRGEGAWLIGRDPRCDVLVGHDPWVSNRHAEVRRDGDGYRLVDLRSTNATRHNWVELPGGAEVEVRHGDVIGVGHTLLLFWQPRS